MSFFGNAKTILKGVLGFATSPAASAIVSLINPALGQIWNRIASSIVSIEAAHAEAGKSKTGTEKLSFVMTDFSEGLAIAREVLKAEGKDLVYDGLALENAINMQVAALNAATKLKESFKIVDIAKA